MGRRGGVFRKLMAFMCSTFSHGKARSGRGRSVSPVDDIQAALASCDGEEDSEPERAVSIAGTADSR